jgi:hypothetical protein
MARGLELSLRADKRAYSDWLAERSKRLVGRANSATLRGVPGDSGRRIVMEREDAAPAPPDIVDEIRSASGPRPGTLDEIHAKTRRRSTDGHAELHARMLRDSAERCAGIEEGR